MNPVVADGEACSIEVELRRTFTVDTTEMEMGHWIDPPCLTKVYEGGCSADETFMLFEYTPTVSQFITMFSMAATVPGENTAYSSLSHSLSLSLSLSHSLSVFCVRPRFICLLFVYLPTTHL